jgi:hypothetical protein
MRFFKIQVAKEPTKKRKADPVSYSGGFQPERELSMCLFFLHFEKLIH